MCSLRPDPVCGELKGGGLSQKTLILYDFFEGDLEPACEKALFYMGFLKVCVFVRAPMTNGAEVRQVRTSISQ